VLKMAVGHSDDIDPAVAIEIAIGQCREALAGRLPQAALLLSGFDSFDAAMIVAIRAAFPGIDVVGATSSAEVSSVGGFAEDSVVLSVFASDDAEITVGIGAGIATDVEAACQAAVEQVLRRVTLEPKVCVVLLDGDSIDPQRSLDALSAALPDGVVVVGGTAARNDFEPVIPTYQFANGVVVEDGIALLLFSGAIDHRITIGTGWRTIGPRGVVSRSRYGAIEEVDGRPAAEFVERYLGVTGPASFGNPIAIVEEGSSDHYLRAIQPGDGGNGWILAAGSVPVGATIQLATAATDDILAGTEDALRRVQAGVAWHPDAALLFSCAVRKFVLGSRTAVEADLARSVLGSSIPFAGMYCFGEIGPVGASSSTRLLNETFVALLLGS
jgi:hypothetical protein